MFLFWRIQNAWEKKFLERSPKQLVLAIVQESVQITYTMLATLIKKQEVTVFSGIHYKSLSSYPV